ncbi:hypothetical protein SARC_10404 [Sphaeroforma arctica JP610]|uniref:PH domain-containing protein n=1 Tax=Sphaeroforma arctica JP610 TaxID=667725 RepID=A0A0L0FK52_9EUKA|nr:hypothetical protein SARC_10404 [Sphaeroforma arctica JP610]KNC77125.1 hypothetical protein SARC_10404 [Sphaeroforma arctica JP610]|eukprot:XP_014151027.1 hypothetical protein SARC_10404 [Sphaeroforma arctica JP610]
MSALLQLPSNAVEDTIAGDGLVCDFSATGLDNPESHTLHAYSTSPSQTETATVKAHKHKKNSPMQNPSARLLRHLMSASTPKDNTHSDSNIYGSDGDDGNIEDKNNTNNSANTNSGSNSGSGTNTPTKRLFYLDVALLQQLNQESNDGIVFAADFQEMLETASRLNFNVAEDINCTNGMNSMDADTMSLASHVGKVISGYMVLYKQGSNVLSESGGSHKPRWVSLTQGGKLVVCKRAENGQYLGKPRIIDLVHYDRCDFVGESKTLITLYSTDRSSNVKSLCFVAPEGQLAWEWRNLINTSINQVKLRSMLRKEVQGTRGMIVGGAGSSAGAGAGAGAEGPESSVLGTVSHMASTRECSEEEGYSASPASMS